MTEKFKSILVRLADKSSSWGVDKDGVLVFRIDGFSKSGTATLKEINGEITCSTRYDTVEVIENYDDIVLIAFRWFTNYSDREPYKQPSHYWIEDFKRLGLIKEHTKTVTTYTF